MLGGGIAVPQYSNDLHMFVYTRVQRPAQESGVTACCYACTWSTQDAAPHTRDKHTINLKQKRKILL